MRPKDDFDPLLEMRKLPYALRLLLNCEHLGVPVNMRPTLVCKAMEYSEDGDMAKLLYSLDLYRPDEFSGPYNWIVNATYVPGVTLKYEEEAEEFKGYEEKMLLIFKEMKVVSIWKNI